MVNMHLHVVYRSKTESCQEDRRGPWVWRACCYCTCSLYLFQSRPQCRHATSRRPSGTATTSRAPPLWRRNTQPPPSCMEARTTPTARRALAPTPGTPTTSSTVQPPRIITTTGSLICPDPAWSLVFGDPIHTDRAFHCADIPGQACLPQFWISASVVEKYLVIFNPTVNIRTVWWRHGMITVSSHLNELRDVTNSPYSDGFCSANLW
jgi:hypothetical protein